jgi:hypothetical protein
MESDPIYGSKIWRFLSVVVRWWFAALSTYYGASSSWALKWATIVDNCAGG